MGNSLPLGLKNILLIKFTHMSIAKKGDLVKVHYTGRLQDGTIFDSSEGREPLEFELGAGMMIAGFDKAVHGMALGDKSTVEIPCGEAYGEATEELYFDVPMEQVPADITPQVGQQLSVQQGDGSSMPVTVKSVDDEKIVLDANHPLAGKDLIFDIELVSIG
jgi:peptidylprolyl isomerase